ACCKPGNALQYGVGIAAHPDRQVRLLERLRLQGDRTEGHIAALEVRLFLSPQLDDRLDIFVAHPAALVEGNAEQVELLLQPPDCERDGHPAAAEPVQRG